MLTRILPLQFRAKASAEGPCGNRALQRRTGHGSPPVFSILFPYLSRSAWKRGSEHQSTHGGLGRPTSSTIARNRGSEWRIRYSGQFSMAT